jgi:anaerobic selenocysteine-containing dehydrogenase
LPNQQIFRRLAAAMGFTEPELCESDAALIAGLLKQTGLPLDFAALARLGTVDYTPEPAIQFRDLTFRTPSGKIEIASDRFVATGMHRVPQPLADARPANGKLRLLSPASRWMMNSSYGNVPKVRSAISDASVVLNPREAQMRGLEEGTPVIVFNDTGHLPLQVTHSESVPCGVALVYKGRWPKLDPSGANVNVLNPGTKADLGQSSTVHSIEVEIRPVAPTPA